MRKYYIGLDVHCAFIEAAVVSAQGKLVERRRCETTIAALWNILNDVGGELHVALEEGPLADWLWRNLHERVKRMVVCEPRRNHLIAKESDKDDAIDAEKLANLLRGDFVKAVHHPESLERTLLKQQLMLYHDRVRGRVREANRLMALFRRHGVFIKEKDLGVTKRKGLLASLPASLREAVSGLWDGYELIGAQEHALRGQLHRTAKHDELLRRWLKVPGIGPVRAVTLLAFLDTPHRFRSKEALWRYLGIGLERWHSGNGPMRVRVGQRCNRMLRETILGAAKSAMMAEKNPFFEQYRRRSQAGISFKNARRNVARSQASVLWGMWKNGSDYDPSRVGVPAAERKQPVSV